jgi:hypothetical protein
VQACPLESLNIFVPTFTVSVPGEGEGERLGDLLSEGERLGDSLALGESEADGLNDGD